MPAVAGCTPTTLTCLKARRLKGECLVFTRLSEVFLELDSQCPAASLRPGRGERTRGYLSLPPEAPSVRRPVLPRHQHRVKPLHQQASDDWL